MIEKTKEKLKTCWKAFVFDHGSYVLHAPTSVIVACSRELAVALGGSKSYPAEAAKSALTSDSLQQELAAIEAALPPAPGPKEEPLIEISAIALNVQESCNLRCSYCYAGDGNYGADSSMSRDNARRIIESLAHGKDFFHVHFFGGEPLLNFDLISHVVNWTSGEDWADTRFTYSLTTNGALLRRDIVDFLKEHRVGITVSYDGAHIQDQQRKTQTGQGSGSLVEKKLRTYQADLKSLPTFKLRSTVSRPYLEAMEQALKVSLANYSGTVAVAKATTDKAGNRFDQDAIRTYTDTMTKIVDQLLDEDDFETIQRFSNVKKYIKMLERGEIHHNTCTAGLRYISVSTSGEYFLCHRFTEDAAAKVGDVEKGLDEDKLRNIREHRLGKNEPCRSCWMRNFCGGGCYHENVLATNSMNQVDRQFCQIQDTEMTLAMKCYTKLLTK